MTGKDRKKREMAGGKEDCKSETVLILELGVKPVMGVALRGVIP